MVFVGTIEYPFRRMIMFHLVADSVKELHEMVDKIGISRRWFQNKKEDGIPHYDICKSKKVLAIKHGAIELNDREILRRCAKNYPDSIVYKLQQSREDKNAFLTVKNKTMEINVNVKISLTEDTAKLLTAFLGGVTVSGTKETAPIVALEKSAKTEKAAKAEKPAKAETGSGAAASVSNEGTDEEAQRLKIREKVVSLRDGGKKDATVELMQEYGVTQLSKLPVDKLTEFMDKLNAIK